MKQWRIEELPSLPKLKIAVVGHIEWVTFLSTDNLPQAGLIGHANKVIEEPAGGGAVIALELARLTKGRVDFFTSLGRDSYGKYAVKKLKKLGLNINVAWRNQPTRRAISMVDSLGERAITVIGDRLQPIAKDALPWNQLQNYDGVFVTATDSEGLQKCREAAFLAATPRIGLKTIQKAKIQIDTLIGSGLDPDEHVPQNFLNPQPKFQIATEGELGGYVWPGGRYKAFPLGKQLIDAYGCGDTFAAGVTVGLAAGWSIEQAISLGSFYGAKCAENFGPYIKKEPQ